MLSYLFVYYESIKPEVERKTYEYVERLKTKKEESVRGECETSM
jgi:hypothetical protein